MDGDGWVPVRLRIDWADNDGVVRAFAGTPGVARPRAGGPHGQWVMLLESQGDIVIVVEESAFELVIDGRERT